MMIAFPSFSLPSKCLLSLYILAFGPWLEPSGFWSFQFSQRVYRWTLASSKQGPTAATVHQHCLLHRPTSLRSTYMSNQWDSSPHQNLQKYNVVTQKFGRKLNSKNWWGARTWTPRSSSLDLQWRLRSEPFPKSLMILTCTFFSIIAPSHQRTRNTSSTNENKHLLNGNMVVILFPGVNWCLVSFIYIYKALWLSCFLTTNILQGYKQKHILRRKYYQSRFLS